MFGKIALATTAASLVFGLGVPAHADVSVAPTADFNGGSTRGADPDMEGTVTLHHMANSKWDVDASFTELDTSKYTILVEAAFPPGSSNTGTPQFKVCDLKGKDNGDTPTRRAQEPKPSKCSNGKLNLWGATPIEVLIYRDGAQYMSAPVVS